MAIYNLVNHLRRKGYHRKPVIIVETGRKAREFIDSAKDNPSWGLEIVGFIDGEKMKIGDRIYGAKILGRFQDLKKVLHCHPVDDVIFTEPEKKFEIGEMIRLCEEEGVTVSIITDFPVGSKTYVQLSMFRNLPLLTLSRIPQAEWQLFLKRIMDIVVSALALVILSPFS